jgi:DNA-binding transcriptional ArsR family regulator
VARLQGDDVDAVFGALADPLRRRILEQLASQGPLTATELAPNYDVTRQAVVKHLAALAGARLLTSERSGREVRYQLRTDQLDGAEAWLAEVGGRWDRRLNALRRRVAGGPGRTPPARRPRL